MYAEEKVELNEIKTAIKKVAMIKMVKLIRKFMKVVVELLDLSKGSSS